MAQLRKTTWVERVHEPNSPEYSIDDIRSRCIRTLDITVPTNNLQNGLQQAISDFLGYSSLINQGGGLGVSYISRIMPHQEPQLGWMYAESIPRIVGVGNQKNSGVIYTTGNPQSLGQYFNPVAGYWTNEGQIPASDYSTSNPWQFATYSVWRFTIVYTARTYPIIDDGTVATRLNGNPDESGIERFVTRTVRPSTSALTLRDGSIVYVLPGAPNVNGQPVPAGTVPKQLPEADLGYTWHRIPITAVPSLFINRNLTNPAIDTAIGRINLTAFDGNLPGTLLLVGAELQPGRQCDGTRVYDITYRFKYRQSVLPGLGVWVATLVWNSMANMFQWAEVVVGTTPNSQPLALTAPGPNQGQPNVGVHIYDAYEFANLFRPGF
jgi:hypothetical protein